MDSHLEASSWIASRKLRFSRFTTHPLTAASTSTCIPPTETRNITQHSKPSHVISSLPTRKTNKKKALLPRLLNLSALTAYIPPSSFLFTALQPPSFPSIFPPSPTRNRPPPRMPTATTILVNQPAPVNHADLTEIDLESGDPSADLDDFDTRTSAIEREIDSIYAVLSKLPRDPAPSFERAERTAASVRQQLALLAEQNRALARTRSLGVATLRIRVTRFGKLARDFANAVSALEAARERHRSAVAARIVDDVVAVDPALGRATVDDALRKGELETVLGTSDKRFQIEDLRERNQQLQGLAKSVNGLRELFIEMGFLTENQQTLINEIEHNVEGVKKDVAHAEDEIVAAVRYKKKVTKKKMIIAAIILVIIAVIIIVIVLQVT